MAIRLRPSAGMRARPSAPTVMLSAFLRRRGADDEGGDRSSAGLVVDKLGEVVEVAGRAGGDEDAVEPDFVSGLLGSGGGQVVDLEPVEPVDGVDCGADGVVNAFRVRAVSQPSGVEAGEFVEDADEVDLDVS